MLVDFWAPWCGPCRSLSPIVDEVADELAGKLAVAKCNVDDNQTAMKFGVMSIPTLIVFKGGGGSRPLGRRNAQGKASGIAGEAFVIRWLHYAAQLPSMSGFRPLAGVLGTPHPTTDSMEDTNSPQ